MKSRAFTSMELLVAIVIIIIIVGLVCSLVYFLRDPEQYCEAMLKYGTLKDVPAYCLKSLLK